MDAERKYIKALRYISWYKNYYEGAEAKIEEFRISSMANLAAVKLKKENHREVVDICTQVIPYFSCLSNFFDSNKLSSPDFGERPQERESLVQESAGQAGSP